MAEYMSERELRKRRRDNIRESEERREMMEWEERRRMEIEEMIQIELEENRQRMELEQRTQMGLEESPQMMEMEERTQIDNQDSRQWPKREKREIVKLGERSPLEAGERRHDFRSNVEESETRSVKSLQGDESVFRAIDEASCSTEMLQDTTFLLKDRKRVKEQDSLSIETRRLDLLLKDIECLGEQYSFMSQQGDRVQDETVKKEIYSSRTVGRDGRNDKGALKEDYSRDQDTERLKEGEPDAYEMHDQTFTFDKRHHESLADRYRQEEESIERLIREKQREKQRELELETYRRELEEERFLLEKERRKRAEEEQNRKFESTWSVEKELREMEKRRREQEYEKIKIEKEQQMRQKVLEDKERRHIEFRIQQSRLQKEQRREKEKMHAIMIYEEKIKAEKEREHRKRMLEIQMQKEMEDRIRKEIEEEMLQRKHKEEQDRRRELKYRQWEEEKELLDSIATLKIKTEYPAESFETKEERQMEERLRLLRKEKEELQLKLNRREELSPAHALDSQHDLTKLNRAFSKPKLPSFDGNQFDEWKLEVTSLVESKLYNEQILSQVIRNSITGKARKVLLTLKASATTKEILKKMEDIYGNIRSGDAIVHDFYAAKQLKDEPCSEWGIRLETIFNQAVERGEIQESRKETKLKERFWRGLQSEKIKVATRTSYESAQSFDILRKKARIEELEIESEKRAAPKPAEKEPDSQKSTEEKSCQSLQNRSTADAKLDILMKKIEHLETSLEEMKKKDKESATYERRHQSYRGRYPYRYRGYNRSQNWFDDRRRNQRDDNSDNSDGEIEKKMKVATRSHGTGKRKTNPETTQSLRKSL